MFYGSGFEGQLGEWLTYGISALAILVCLGVIARALLVPSDVRRVCCCGGCGYAMGDRIPEQCPECGGRIAKVGVSTPAMAVRLRGGLGWALLAWSVICGSLAQVGWGYVQQAAWAAAMSPGMMGGSGPTQHSWQTKFAPNRFSSGARSNTQPTDDLNFRIDGSLSWVSDGGTVESGTVTLTLQRNGEAKQATMSLDLAERTFELNDASDAVVRKGGAADIDETLLKLWFEKADIDTSGPSFARVIADSKRLLSGSFDDPEGVQSGFSGFGMTDELGALRSQGGSSSSGPVGGMGGMPVPEYWTVRTQLVGGILGLVYITGAVLIWWRHRRLLA